MLHAGREQIVALFPTHDVDSIVDDHGHVIGHFQRRPAAGGSGRRFHSYDLLGSASQFGQADFEQVWGDVFGFCVGR